MNNPLCRASCSCSVVVALFMAPMTMKSGKRLCFMVGDSTVSHPVEPWFLTHHLSSCHAGASSREAMSVRRLRDGPPFPLTEQILHISFINEMHVYRP